MPDRRPYGLMVEEPMATLRRELMKSESWLNLLRRKVIGTHPGKPDGVPITPRRPPLYILTAKSSETQSGEVTTEKPLLCCYLFPTEKEPEGDIENPCEEDAEWVIWDGIEPFYDHYWHACTGHVGELLTDSKENHQVYPVKWDKSILETA